MFAKICEDIYYSTSGVPELDYEIRLDDRLVFRGKAFADANENIKIKISKLCSDWLENKLPDFREFEDEIIQNDKAFLKFDLYIFRYAAGSSIPYPEFQGSYEFLFCWNKDFDFDGSDILLSNPINGHLDSRMKLLFTKFSEVGGNICYEV